MNNIIKSRYLPIFIILFFSSSDLYAKLNVMQTEDGTIFSVCGSSAEELSSIRFIGANGEVFIEPDYIKNNCAIYGEIKNNINSDLIVLFEYEGNWFQIADLQKSRNTLHPQLIGAIIGAITTLTLALCVFLIRSFINYYIHKKSYKRLLVQCIRQNNHLNFEVAIPSLLDELSKSEDEKHLFFPNEFRLDVTKLIKDIESRKRENLKAPEFKQIIEKSCKKYNVNPDK